MSTTTIAVLEIGCASIKLPPDFPRPKHINLCVPITAVIDGRKVVTHYRCRRTDQGSDKKRTEAADYVHVGIPVDDWNMIQDYRSDVELYFQTHTCTKD